MAFEDLHELGLSVISLLRVQYMNRFNDDQCFLSFVDIFAYHLFAL